MSTTPSTRIAVIIGTRPEAIKLNPIVDLLGPDALVVHTGQHYSPGMTGHLTPHIALDARIGPDTGRGQQLGTLTTELDRLFTAHAPAAVLVHGDTTSTLAGALAANTSHTPLIHVEAGLRSFDRHMPEEHHRVLADHLANLCCAPTPQARDNLLAEHIPPDRIHLTGNTVVEAATTALPDAAEQTRILTSRALQSGSFVLATIHRPENVDHPTTLASILHQLAESPVPVVFPLHPRTHQRITEFGLTDLARRLRLTPPLDYPHMLTILRHAIGLVTDSGGLQEEATVLKRPLLIIRRSNERPETERDFGSRITPINDGLPHTIMTWHSDAAAITARLSRIPTPFGDGTAATHVIRALRSYLHDHTPLPLPAHTA